MNTKELIAELKKRRPDCAKCRYDDITRFTVLNCERCIWNGVRGTQKDNFREVK